MRLIVAVVVLASLSGCAKKPVKAVGRRMIVLGVDGMDPAFLERHWNDLPNLNRLRGMGDFRRLETTMPPQSPVAWATVITGLDPDGHGIYDFIHRNPVTKMPMSSMAESTPASRVVPLGPYAIPLKAGSVHSLRKGTAFWHTLSEHGIPATVIRMPVNFPPEQCEAESLSGMGTPDLEGSFGTFQFFTNDPDENRDEVSGGRITHISLKDGRAELRVRGPENSLRRDHAVSRADLTLYVDPTEPAVRIDAPGRRVVLREGDWSEWIRLEFPLVPGLKSAVGIVRIYLQKAHPYVRVYVSPVNIDPENPELPISTPADFSRILARRLGPFYTQGIAEDSSAYRAGVLNRAEYLVQSNGVLRDSLRMFREELARFQDGLLFYYFSSIDQHSHMLWERHENVLLETYRQVDQAIGLAMEKTDTPLLVISDHGFAPFRRAVHLNAWLRQEGYEKQAHAMGLNSVYVDVAGVADEISKKLLDFRDPVSKEVVVSHVYRTKHGPALLVGYRSGYRASWQTALGEAPRSLIDDNNDAWIGDHCMSPEEVPGVLLSNRKVRVEKPRLSDVPTTILDYFGVARKQEMVGSTVF